MQLWALIVDSFRESLDRKIFWVLVVITLLIAVTMFCVGLEPDKISVMFGLWEIETDALAPIAAATGEGLNESRIASFIVYGLMDVVLGSFGVFLAVIATASFFPTFLERGAIDVVLSKPMSRLKLFLGKYLGSMVFVFVQATLFVLLTFVAAGVRWGVWIPEYLLAVPLIVLLFSYIYCVSAWAGVRFRSPVVAIFVSVGAWAIFVGIQGMGDLFIYQPSWKENKTLYHTVQAALWITPKTQDVTYLTGKLTGAGTSADIMPEPGQEQQSMYDRANSVEWYHMNLSPWYTIGTSLLFEAIILAMTIWHFSKQDF